MANIGPCAETMHTPTILGGTLLVLPEPFGRPVLETYKKVEWPYTAYCTYNKGTFQIEYNSLRCPGTYTE